MAWASLCELDELEEGRGRYVEVDGFRLAVFLQDGRVFVIDDECPHAGGSLSAGRIDAGCAVCPRHGWAFELETGALRNSPGCRIGRYLTRLLERPGHAVLVQADLPIY